MCLITSIIIAFERLKGENLEKETKGSLKHPTGPLTSTGSAQRVMHGNERG